MSGGSSEPFGGGAFSVGVFKSHSVGWPVHVLVDEGKSVRRVELVSDSDHAIPALFGGAWDLDADVSLNRRGAIDHTDREVAMNLPALSFVSNVPDIEAESCIVGVDQFNGVGIATVRAVLSTAAESNGGSQSSCKSFKHLICYYLFSFIF